MKKMIAILAAALCFSIVASPAFAGSDKQASKHKIEKKMSKMKAKKSKKPGKVSSVPEIDAASAGISLALIAGIVAIGRERRRKS